MKMWDIAERAAQKSEKLIEMLVTMLSGELICNTGELKKVSWHEASWLRTTQGFRKEGSTRIVNSWILEEQLYTKQQMASVQSLVSIAGSNSDMFPVTAGLHQVALCHQLCS